MILMFLINFGEIRSCIDKSNKKLIKELTEKSTKKIFNRQSFKNTTKNYFT